MAVFQIWLASVLYVPAVAEVMRMAFVWPLAESVHFIGLSLLVGTVVLFDLRLLGIARGIPAAAWHRLIRYGLIGFALNAATGLLFLMTEPDQYIYNPSFMLKMAFIATAGLNALSFYFSVGPRLLAPGVPLDAPRTAKVIAAASLTLWMCVIIAGRLLTFYRPFDCAPGEATGLVLLCVPGKPQ
ncbi:MAG: hypothetical protein FJW27_03910 [Acidimicrobiia bacterium]|nr:hypothetical protein [Acidimicrobiia bacterium]